jgi:hypothetical protein
LLWPTSKELSRAVEVDNPTDRLISSKSRIIQKITSDGAVVEVFEEHG